MIQKYIPVSTTKEILIREIRSVEHWAKWMPDVQSAAVVKSDGPRIVVRVVIKAMTTIDMTMELDCCAENKIKFRQIKGWFKSYAGDYTVLPAPDGTGIVFRITLDADAGMFAPKGMVYSKLTAMLDKFEGALKIRLQHCAAAEPCAVIVPSQHHGSRPSAPQPPRRKLAHLFSTRHGLEVWIAGRPHLLRTIA